MSGLINSNNGSLLPNRTLYVDEATPGAGPLAPARNNNLSPRFNTYLTQDHNIKTKIDNSSLPILNSRQETSQQYINNKYVNFTGREQYMPTVIQQLNLKSNTKFTNLVKDDAKVTTKETTLYSINGNPERQHDGHTVNTYEDAPKTTTNETTLYSASGNPERQHDGHSTYTYEDKPKITTNETTLYSYSGDVNGGIYNFNQSNRTLFTGEFETFNGVNKETFSDDTINNLKSIHYKTVNAGASAGPTKFNQRGDTLVENYLPAPNGNQNIQLNANSKIGNSTKLNFDNDITNTDGPGGYTQSSPNAQNFQQVSSSLVGEVKANPYKSTNIIERQTANYLINNLQNNDFSIYQRPEQRNKSHTNSFFVDSNAQDHSGIETASMPYQKLNEYILPNGNVNVFEDNKYDPNSRIVFNTEGQSNSNIENPLLFQGKNPKKYNTYHGLGYSNTAIQANKEKPKIFLDTDSTYSSKYLNYFDHDGYLNNVMNVSNVIKPVRN